MAHSTTNFSKLCNKLVLLWQTATINSVLGFIAQTTARVAQRMEHDYSLCVLRPKISHCTILFDPLYQLPLIIINHIR